MGGEIFLTCPDRPWGPPSLLYYGYRVFPGVKRGRGVTLTPHLLLAPWSRKSRAIPLLPLWAVQPVQSLSACTRVHVTFHLFSTVWGIVYVQVRGHPLVHGRTIITNYGNEICFPLTLGFRRRSSSTIRVGYVLLERTHHLHTDNIHIVWEKSEDQ